MTAEQAIYNFWSGFDLPAYDEYSVPDESSLPYLTYSFSYDSFGGVVSMSASIWYRTTSWTAPTNKAQQIITAIGRGGKQLRVDNGSIWLTLANPAYQRLGSENVDIKRVYFNLQAEYITTDT